MADYKSDTESNNDEPDLDSQTVNEGNNSNMMNNVIDEYDKLEKLLPKKDPIIKITLFKCNDGMHISDIELVSHKIINIRKLRTIENLEENLEENDETKKQLHFISKKGKTHEEIMSIYLVLSNPVNIMLGNVIDVKDPRNKDMIEKEYDTKITTINNDLCTMKFKISNFVALLDEVEIFFYIVKLLIISKELVKKLFDDWSTNKEVESENRIIYIPTDKPTITSKIKKIIEENEMLNTELTLLESFIEELIENQHTMEITQLKVFYTNLKTKIGLFVGTILGQRADEKNIDKFEDIIYDPFRKKKAKGNTTETEEEGKSINEMESPLDVSELESIKNNILDKIEKVEYYNPTYDPLKTTNPVKQNNDLVLLKMNENIENAENEKAIEITKPEDRQYNKPLLLLKKNYLITLFIITYIKMQYMIYDEYMKKNKKITGIMKIYLLDKLYTKANNKMDAIFEEALEQAGEHKDDIKRLQDEFENVNSALRKLKVSVEHTYKSYKPHKKPLKTPSNKPIEGPLPNNGASKTKKK
jgi:hypothetical protein